MSSDSKILIQLDTDPHPSVFDRVVAVDSGCDHLFSYGGVTPENVVPLVHGAIFTRGPAKLRNTALFVGGSNVRAGEELTAAIRKAFFGPMRTSLAMDSNGCNTTAAAAVLVAARHLPTSGCRALILGGTGPVGLRIARILAERGVGVVLASRSADRARQAAEAIAADVPNAAVSGIAPDRSAEFRSAAASVDVLFAAGAAGVEFLPAGTLAGCQRLKVAVDVNAVPPVGLGDVNVQSSGSPVEHVATYGALGVGGLKMKIHKAMIRSLFEANDREFNTSEIVRLGEAILAEA